MLTRTIEYTDYNGENRKEEFYFNLNKAELIQLQMSVKGGWTEHVRRVVAAKDEPAIMDVFTDIIRRSYGIKSADGKRFIKKPEYTEEFMQTEAYSNLFMELFTDSEAGLKFIDGIIPGDVDIKDAQAQAQAMISPVN